MKSLRALLSSRRRDAQGADDQGFTLVELVVAIGLIGFVFAAVAAIMTSSLKALAVQKARTQGNEVATQAIEDLQRREFNLLVLCTKPDDATPPAGLSDIVYGSACPAGATNANYAGEDPCNGLSPLNAAPKAQYVCTRMNIAYTVKRYIAWTDDTHTSKRLAVFVTWQDSVGLHEVAQQSSLRAPTAQSVIGLAAPTLSSGSAAVTEATVSDTGELVTGFNVSVTSANLQAGDTVFAKFLNVASDGSQFTESVQLTNAGNSWTGSIPAGLRFPVGTQHMTFEAFRAKDGKTTSTFGTGVKFCVAAGCPENMPVVHTLTAPSPVMLTAAGGLVADLALSAKTDNVPTTGRVQALLSTRGGVLVVDLAPDSSCTSAASCTWSTVIPKASGYSFDSDAAAKVQFSASQPFVQGSTDPSEQGSTGSAIKTVEFRG